MGMMLSLIPFEMKLVVTHLGGLLLLLVIISEDIEIIVLLLGLLGRGGLLLGLRGRGGKDVGGSGSGGGGDGGSSVRGHGVGESDAHLIVGKDVGHVWIKGLKKKVVVMMFNV